MNISLFLLVVIVAFLVLLERKLLGGVQIRTGPMAVGFYGVVQTVVDGVKLFSKRIYIFKFSGIIFLLVALQTRIILSVLFIIFCLVLLSYCFLLCVYESNNLYSMLGRLRSVIVIIAFDVVFFIVLISDISLILVILMLFVFSSECGRTPIDLVERESELVSGFNTEYSGAIFVMFFLGEYVMIIVFFHILLGQVTISTLLPICFVIF
jgi:NADH:ubiquinone oxidoreductase subunit H